MPQKERDVFIREAADQAIFDSSPCGKTAFETCLQLRATILETDLHNPAVRPYQPSRFRTRERHRPEPTYAGQ